MMGEDRVRFAQLVHELQPRIRAFQITQFMCSAWMKPVCVHTMGHGYKTVNASPILGDPSHVEVILFKRLHFSSIPCVFYLCFPLNCWIRCKMYFFLFLTEKQIPLCRPNTEFKTNISTPSRCVMNNTTSKGQVLSFVVHRLYSHQCKGSYTPGFCTLPAPSATSLLDHAYPLQWRIKGPESSTQKVIWSTPAVGSGP